MVNHDFRRYELSESVSILILIYEKISTSLKLCLVTTPYKTTLRQVDGHLTEPYMVNGTT